MAEQYAQIAEERLVEAGFHSKPLIEFEFPEIISAETNGVLTRHSLFGDAEAHTAVYSVIPYSTRLEDPSIQLRLAAQQAVVGTGYALYGVEVYNPTDMRLQGKQHKTVAGGDFLPLADRLLAVIETTAADDQDVALYGYSMGADVSVEAAHATLTDVNRGFRAIEFLGAYEPARTMRRGRIAMVDAFAKSGPDLWENVLKSKSLALLEARGIDPQVLGHTGEKRHNAAVTKGVTKYTLADLRGNFALIAGFGHSTTISQLEAMSFDLDAPIMTLGRMASSPITTGAPVFARSGLKRVKYEKEDHSAADNLLRSGQFILETLGV